MVWFHCSCDGLVHRNRLVDYLANSNTGRERKRKKKKKAKPVDNGLSSVCMGFMPYSKQAKIIKHVIQLASAHVRDSGYVYMQISQCLKLKKDSSHGSLGTW